MEAEIEDCFCYDLSFLPHTDKMRWRDNEEIKVYSKNNYDTHIVENKKLDEEVIRNLVLKGENIALKYRIDRYDKEKEYNRKTAEKYSKPMTTGMPLFSENLGSRRLRLLQRNSKYDELNEIVKNIYIKTRQGDKNVDVYSEMQHVTREKTDWNDEAFVELVRKCGDLHKDWTIECHSSDAYWMQIEVGDKTTYHSISKIKVYVTSKGECVKDLLIGAVEKLMIDGHKGFELMVSKVQRDGTICFFVGTEEFYILEDYFKEHADEIIKGNRFIAHRGLLGISRDLMDINSHNGQQATLLADYFSIIDDPDQIDLEEMYRLFVLGWNGELAEDNVFTKDFKNCTAQMFVLMIDSLDVLLGRTEINDDSLLLNDDSDIWYALADAKCWGEIKWKQ